MTGYTHELVEKNQTFQQFAMSCAKAFGANIMLRDEPSDTPIPEQYEVADYYAKSVVDAKSELAGFEAMNTEQQLALAETEKMREIDAAIASMHKNELAVQKMRDTLEQVTAWTPPTADHQNFKAFMVEQLAKSIEWELGGGYYEDRIAKLKTQDAATLVSERIARLHKSVASSIEEHAKEVDRVASRNKWNRDLRNSLTH